MSGDSGRTPRESVCVCLQNERRPTGLKEAHVSVCIRSECFTLLWDVFQLKEPREHLERGFLQINTWIGQTVMFRTDQSDRFSTSGVSC